MILEYPQRKHPRLKAYDYSQNGAYFVTICATGRRERFGYIPDVGRDDPGAPPAVCRLSREGEIVARYIETIPQGYPDVAVEKYVIMPNHIHLLLAINGDEMRRAGSLRPTQLLPRIVAALKRFTNRDAGCRLWQSGYHEHIIRDDNDFLLHWQYIDQNPARWGEDEYYAENAGGAP